MKQIVDRILRRFNYVRYNSLNAVLYEMVLQSARKEGIEIHTDAFGFRIRISACNKFL